ncbi:hypothetical protein [Rhizobium leguminosarum]|uniref:hypothetical protein n=1 Tax=Rhizobium leguminosarum TaxID=384 RepID=UPI003D7C149E
MLNRRTLLAHAGGAAAALDIGFTKAGAENASQYVVAHTDAELRHMRSGDQYAVLRQAQTEYPYVDPKKVSYGLLLQFCFSVPHDPTSSIDRGPIPEGITVLRSSRQMTSSQRSPGLYRPAQSRRRVWRGHCPQDRDGQDGLHSRQLPSGFPDKQPTYPDIVINDLPKIASLKQMFPSDYRDKPVLVASAGGN